MAGEYSLALYMAIGIGGALFVGFSSPKLTEADTGRTSNSVHLELVRTEASYCRNNVAGVDCACFAGKSTHVISNKSAPLSEVRYVETEVLARGQAKTNC